MEVSIEKTSVQLSKLQPDSILKKAGLKEGDILETIGGSAIDSEQSLRRYLRRAIIAGDVPFSIVRDGKPLEVAVSFP
jgi:S1-C subfamily serine protease